MKSDTSASPQRSCVACRTQCNKKDMLRFVAAPDDQILLDYRQKLPGRGFYSCATSDCLAVLVKRNLAARALRRTIQPLSAEQLASQLKKAIEQKIYNLVGMARKAGQLVSGTQAVLDCLRKPAKPGLILLALDISPAFADKIGRAADYDNIVVARMFTKQTLGQLLGKEERSAIALNDNSLAQNIVQELKRVEQLVREI